MKSESHKGKNTDENFLIDMYYNNFYFFATNVIGAEVCTVMLFLLAKVQFLRENIIILAIQTVFCGILACKMTINVF